jgi:hypothetical protein
VAGAMVLMFLAGTVGGLAWTRMQGAKPFCARIEAATPAGELLAAEDAKFEQIMFYTLRPTIFVDSDEKCVDLLRSGRCRYAVILRERYERVRSAAPVARLAVLVEGEINRDGYVLIGPPR